MTFILVLLALIALLYLGMPMFAGMVLFSTVVMVVVRGKWSMAREHSGWRNPLE